MMAGRELPGCGSKEGFYAHHQGSTSLFTSVYRRECPSSRKCGEACEIDLRRDLFNNIVLSGGNTMFPGLAERLECELKAHDMQ